MKKPSKARKQQAVDSTNLKKLAAASKTKTEIGRLRELKAWSQTD